MLSGMLRNWDAGKNAIIIQIHAAVISYCLVLLYHYKILTTKEHNRITKEENDNLIPHKRKFSILKILFC